MFPAPIRSLCQFLVGLFAAALVMHTWLAMGLVAPVAVSGSSMAPTLRGPHRTFYCDPCRGEFAVGLDQLNDDTASDCPRCGSRSTQPVADRRGDRLVVDRTAFAFRAPRRWEVVVFRSPEDATELCVKRIVGLPGETVALVDGEVWINGQMVGNPHGMQYVIRYGDHPEQGTDHWRLGRNEYFVLGDNEAISDDSRNWAAGPGLDAELLVGKPFGVP
jgi:signal peptidase I